MKSELRTGPHLLNSLVGGLFKFRERAVAVTGDIREMFLQVKIIKEDRNAQCFLWRGIDRINEPRTYQMTFLEPLLLHARQLLLYDAMLMTMSHLLLQL